MVAGIACPRALAECVAEVCRVMMWALLEMKLCKLGDRKGRLRGL